jgi:methylmalonyl-CoA/ethylmalonyl-CoA epimerase
MIRRIDHIAIAVRDLEKGKDFFINGLGGRELFSKPVPGQKYRWTTLELGTSCFIELIDPLEKDGFVHRFLEGRGEGPHHITIQVDDIQETQRTLTERGIPTFGFAEVYPGWTEMYVHPRHAFGTLIQFAEFRPLDWVNPGYVPPSYWEFAPPQMVASGGEEVEVKKVATEGGPKVQIRKGHEIIQFSPEEVDHLVEALRSLPPDPISKKTQKKRVQGES